MTQLAKYSYKCDSVDCGAVSPVMDVGYTLPPNWGQFIRQGATGNGIGSITAHICPACCEAVNQVLQKPVKFLSEEYYK